MTGRLARARALAAESRDLAEQTEQETWIEHRALGAGLRRRAGRRRGRRRGPLRARCSAASSDNPDAIVERMARDVLGITAFAAGGLRGGRPAALARRRDRRVSARAGACRGALPGDHAEAVIALGDLDRARAPGRALEARARSGFRARGSARSSARCRGLLLAARGDLDGALASLQAGARPRTRAARDAGRAGADPARAGAGAPQAEAAAEGAGGASRRRSRVFEQVGALVVGGARTGRAGARPRASCAGRADSDGGEDRRPRRGRSHEPRDRGADLRQPEDRGGEPRARLPQARHPLARRARPRDGGATGARRTKA